MATDQKQGPSIDSVIERVKKMWNKAQSAHDIGSIEEAKAFAEAVQKTLAHYKLDMSVLSVEQKDARDPLGRNNVNPLHEIPGAGRKQKRIWWIEDLAGMVARAHYCQILVYKGSSIICVVGRESDRQVASYMIIVLTRLAMELCQQGYWKARYVAFKETGTYNTGDFKESFYRGFIDGLRQRYDDLRRAEQNSSNGMALVLVRSHEEVTKFMKEEIKPSKGTSIRSGSARNGQGYAAGVNAAKAANLSGKAANAGTQAKQVSPARGQLGGGR